MGCSLYKIIRPCLLCGGFVETFGRPRMLSRLVPVDFAQLRSAPSMRPSSGRALLHLVGKSVVELIVCF